MRKRPGSTSPFARDSEAAGQRPRWESKSEKVPATPHIAGQLGIQPGDPGDTVMHTRYRYLADDNPIQLADSYEPIAVTGGTQVEYPKQGSAVGGRAERQAVIVMSHRHVYVCVTSRS
ncbi:UTRA domain-containing protein [Micromonospora sp. LOL_024]|uniref:UTRA domain-containing protein n=1 Tax=Micromonospora sp. LOL_024 TaxID=3345412 RepID=UPI003A8C09EC